MLRRRMMMAQGGESLPAGYTKIEYLESDGNNYIDTGFKPNQDSRIVMDWQMINATDLATLYCAFGCRGGGIYSALYKASKNKWDLMYYYGNTFTQGFTIDYSARHLSDYDKNSCTIDGVTLTYTAQTWQSAYSWFLCADNKAGSPSGSVAMRIYSCQIYDNGTLVRDFIPAMNASGEAGLYDLKNDVWYALLPVAKPKVENKISIWFDFPDDGRVLYGVESQYPLASNVTVSYRGDDRFVNQTSVYYDSKVMSEGSQKSTVWELITIIPGDILISKGRTIASITSISPTEDDTYIYTF